MPSVLTLAPDQSGYSVEDGDEVLSVKLDGGLSRYRRDVVGASSAVRVQWTIGPVEYRYLRAFYRTVTTNGSEAFSIDLILDDATLTRHEAHFVPGSMKLAGVSGLTYTVQASLEVKPAAPDAAYDQALVDWYDAYEGYSAEFVTDLEQFVNVYLPSVR